MDWANTTARWYEKHSSFLDLMRLILGGLTVHSLCLPPKFSTTWVQLIFSIFSNSWYTFNAFMLLFQGLRHSSENTNYVFLAFPDKLHTVLLFNMTRPKQNGWPFVDNILYEHFVKRTLFCISIQISVSIFFVIHGMFQINELSCKFCLSVLIQNIPQLTYLHKTINT